MGQQAKCKCGTVVELDPDWDAPQRKTKRRPSNDDRSPATAKPAKKRKQAPPAAAKKNSQKQTAVKSRTSQVPERSRKSKKQTGSQPNSAPAPAATKPDQQTLDVSPQAAPELPSTSTFDYSDLDQILAAGVDHTPLESTRIDSPFEKPAAADKPNRRGVVGAVIGGLAGLATAFGFLVTRLASFSGTPLGWTGNSLYGTYTASVGTGEMTPAVTNMFVGFGWWLLLLAVLTGIGSVLLLCRVGIRISAGRKVIGWSRGLLATTAVVSLFSLLGLLFVETIHHGNLIHDLDSFSSSAPIDGFLESQEDFETFQDIRQQYKTESTDFMIGVLTFAVLPLISFGGVATSLLFDER